MTLRWTEADQLSPEWRDGLLGPGKLFELIDAEVLGTVVPVFARRARSLGEVVDGMGRHGDRPFLISDHRTIDFADAPAIVAGAAAHLADRHGVRPGDRIATIGGVSVEHVIAIWATTALGAIVVPLNPASTTAELAHALAVTRPTVVLTDRTVDLPVSDLPVSDLPAIGPPVVDLASVPIAPTGEVEVGAIDEDDPFAIVFTSGTTGRPKGATLSHRNAIQFALAAAATSAVHSIVHELPAPPPGAPVVMGSAPLFHVSGLLGQLVNSAQWGTTIVVPPPGRWDATTHLELTERHRVTSWSLVPTQLSRLIDHPELDRFDLSSLQMVGGGGATFAPDLLRRTSERLPHVRLTLRVGYGMTETAGTVTLLQPPVDAERRASVGPPVAGTEVDLRDAACHSVPDGEVGQIWVRSGQVFLGYWDDAEATAAALDDDRWYATGDFGRSDGEYLFLESRLRDLIIRGGENIYPIEIENRLVEHPAIAEAAVVGVPDDDLGQTVKAVIVVAAGGTVTGDDVRQWVADTLARHKVPSIVEIRDSLPQNDSGKVLKHLL